MLEQSDHISEILALSTDRPGVISEKGYFSHEVVPAKFLDKGLRAPMGQADGTFLDVEKGLADFSLVENVLIHHENAFFDDECKLAQKLYFEGLEQGGLIEELPIQMYSCFKP